MGKADIIAMLEEATERGLAALGTDKLTEGRPGLRAMVRVKMLNEVALGFITSLAEESKDSWSTPALREALREIFAAGKFAIDESQHAFFVSNNDPDTLRNRALLMGLPEDATEQDFIDEFKKRTGQAGDDEDDGREPEPEPV